MSKHLVTRQEFDDSLLNYKIHACCVRDRNIFYFIAHDLLSTSNPAIAGGDIEKRIIAFIRDDPEGDRLGFDAVKGFEWMHCASPRKPKSQLVAVDRTGSPIIYGAGDCDFEDELASSPTGPLRGAVANIRTIGDHVYVVTSTRGVCRRTGPAQWESLCPELGFEVKGLSRRDRKRLQQETESWGFDDISGFSEDDLYACGGLGDVMRYRDGEWKSAGFPFPQVLKSICCAGDGNVYIGGLSTSIFMGRGDEWVLLHKGKNPNPFTDLVWYEAKLWGTNSDGLWVLEGKEMVPADISDEIAACRGHLSVADGVMLMAGEYGAAFRENGEWHQLFDGRHAALHPK